MGVFSGLANASFGTLLAINMAATAVAATLGDMGTQRMERYFRQPPAKRRKVKEKQEGEEDRATPESVDYDDLDEEELEDWLDADGKEVAIELRFYKGATCITVRDIKLTKKEGAEDKEEDADEGEEIIEAEQKGTVVKVPGDTPGSLCQVAFLLGGKTVCFDAMPGDVELYLQEYDPWRTARMVLVVAVFFEPISFTWYTVLLPKIVPGHAGQLTFAQMKSKIMWDVFLYGSMVVFINIANNAILQANDAKIEKENMRQGVTKCGHVGRRIAHDMPPMWCIMVVGSTLEDIPGFLFIAAKWQSLAFKICDLSVLFVMSYIINLRMGVKDEKVRLNRIAEPAPSKEGE